MPSPSATDLQHQALATEHCRDGATRLAAVDAAALAASLPGWTIVDGALRKQFAFADFDATMAFVNAVAFVARSQNHHPDLAVHYARCDVTFSTHDAGGLTRNDFICAARTERLFA
jgi:4a-hydroxytetrahydrobiopterin dehydratase